MKVYSIFSSLNGEVCSAHQGSPTTFIRLAGCNLNCRWCDTKYAQSMDSGKDMSVAEVFDKVLSLPFRRVTITGGEPLLQLRELKELVRTLGNGGFSISIETNGSLSTNYIGWRNVDCWVVDFKLPSSGEYEKMMIENFLHLEARDWIKFVVADPYDYRKMVDTIIELEAVSLLGAVNIAVSPILKELKVSKLIKWLELEDRIDSTHLVVNLQLHKLTDFGEPN